MDFIIIRTITVKYLCHRGPGIHVFFLLLVAYFCLLFPKHDVFENKINCNTKKMGVTGETESWTVSLLMNVSTHQLKNSPLMNLELNKVSIVSRYTFNGFHIFFGFIREYMSTISVLDILALELYWWSTTKNMYLFLSIQNTFFTKSLQ